MKRRNGFVVMSALVLALIVPSVAAATLSIGIDSDTSRYSTGENVILTATDDPFSPVTITVSNSTGYALYNGSGFQINSTGKLVVQLNTSSYPAGEYRIRVTSGSDSAAHNFTVVSPYISLGINAVKANGAGYAMPAPVYYYYNGSAMHLMVNASAPNSHFSVSVDLGGFGMGVIKFSPAANGTFARGTYANGTGWYAFMANVSIPSNYSAVAVRLVPVSGLTAAGAAGSSMFLAAINIEPKAMDTSLRGNTTDWRTIADFTNITGLTFEKVSAGVPVARVTLHGQIDLCRAITAYSLLNLADNVRMGLGMAFINATALPAMSGPAEIRMYGLAGHSMPGILKDGVPVLNAGQTSGGPVASLVWNWTTLDVAFNVTSMGLYMADGLPPFLVSSMPVSHTYINSSSPSLVFIMNDTISGLSATGASFNVGNQSGALAVSGSFLAGWTAAFSASGLQDGWHTAYINVGDAVNNMVMLAINFAVDTDKPSFISSFPVNDSFVNTASPELSASYTDALSGVVSARIYIDAVDVTQSASWTPGGIKLAQASNLSEGAHKFVVEVVDMVGNRNSISSSFTVDFTAPVITLFHPQDAMLVPLNDSIYVNFNDRYGIRHDLVRLWVDGVEVTNVSDISSARVLYWPVPPLAKGSHYASVSIVDYANNEKSASWVFLVDNVPPLFADFKPGNGSTITTKAFTISISMYDNLQVNESSLKIKVDGQDVRAQSTVTRTGVTYNANLEYGQHRVDVDVMDSSFNVGYATLLFTIVEYSGPSQAMITDFMIMAVLIIVIVVVLVLVFMKGGRGRADQD